MGYLRSILIGSGFASLSVALAIVLALLIQLGGYNQSGDFLLLLLTTTELFLYFLYRQSSRERTQLKRLTDSTAVVVILLWLFLIWHGLVMHDTYPLARYFEPLAIVIGAVLGTYIGNHIYSSKRFSRYSDGD